MMIPLRRVSRCATRTPHRQGRTGASQTQQLELHSDHAVASACCSKLLLQTMFAAHMGSGRAWVVPHGRVALRMRTSTELQRA